MDSVRFGRALGFGARSAAKALITAVDAASAPNPSAPNSSSQRPAPKPSPAPTAAAAQTPSSAAPRTPLSPASPAAPSQASSAAPSPSGPVQTAARVAADVQKNVQRNVQQTRAGVARGSKRFGGSVWRPFVKLSGVLWLEMTGSFFALFALFSGQNLWTHRADLHATAGHTAHQHFLITCGATLMFAYFSVSSFVKARRRSRAH